MVEEGLIETKEMLSLIYRFTSFEETKRFSTTYCVTDLMI